MPSKKQQISEQELDEQFEKDMAALEGQPEPTEGESQKVVTASRSDVFAENAWVKADLVRELVRGATVTIPFDADASSVAERLICIADEIYLKMTQRGWIEQHEPPLATE